MNHNTLNHIYTYLDELNKKYSPFDPNKWIPPTFRNRKDSDYIYKNIKYKCNTKTHTYELYSLQLKRSIGIYHGRLLNDLLKMKEN